MSNPTHPHTTRWTRTARLVLLALVAGSAACAGPTEPAAVFRPFAPRLSNTALDSARTQSDTTGTPNDSSFTGGGWIDPNI